jgi:hypothetical protein
MGIDVVMQAHTAKLLTDDEIRTTSYKLCEAVGHNEFWLDVEHGQFALYRAEQDSWYEPTPDQPIGGTTLTVSTLWRYYGPGYERGPWPTIHATIEFLERNGFTVYYGGDSGGAEELVKITPEYKNELWDCFCKVGHSPYRSMFGSRDPKSDCPYCKNPMYAYGWNIPSLGAIRYNCPGCGYKCYTADRGQTFVATEEESGVPT